MEDSHRGLSMFQERGFRSQFLIGEVSESHYKSSGREGSVVVIAGKAVCHGGRQSARERRGYEMSSRFQSQDM